MMILLKRALMQIRTKKMKSLLLLGSFFVIGTFIITMYSVQRNVEDTKFLIRSEMSGIVEYTLDHEAMKEYYLEEVCNSDLSCWSEYSGSDEFIITNDEIQEMVADERVAAINGLIYKYISSESVSPIVKDENIDDYSQAVYENEFKLIGNGYEKMIEFESKGYTLISGRFYTESEIQEFSQVALITEEVAEENGLKVGDHIVLGDREYSGSGGDITEAGMMPGYRKVINGEFLDLEVIGIYSNNQEQKEKENIFDVIKVYENRENTILIPATTLEEYHRTLINLDFKLSYDNGEFFENEEDYLNALYDLDREDILKEVKIAQYFLLKDPNDVDKFMLDYDYLNTNFRILNANNDQYLRLKGPLDLLGDISQVVLMIALMVSVIFMSLITTFNFKMREYEFGLQLSLGVTKIRIAFQIFIELFLISTMGFLLSLGSSRMIANQVDDMIIDYMIYESGKITMDYSMNFYFNGGASYFEEVQPEAFFENYKSEWDASFIIFSYILIILVIMISSIIPTIILLKQSPKMILMNRE